MEECHCYKGSVRLFSVAVAVWYQASSPTIRPLIPLPMASHSVLKISTWVLNINPEKGEKVKRRKESPKKKSKKIPKGLIRAFLHACPLSTTVFHEKEYKKDCSLGKKKSRTRRKMGSDPSSSSFFPCLHVPCHAIPVPRPPPPISVGEKEEDTPPHLISLFSLVSQ